MSFTEENWQRRKMENSGTGTRWKPLAQAQDGKLWNRHKMEDKVHLFGENDGEIVSLSGCALYNDT